MSPAVIEAMIMYASRIMPSFVDLSLLKKTFNKSGKPIKPNMIITMVRAIRMPSTVINFLLSKHNASRYGGDDNTYDH